jgi:hypothetical protein
MDCGGRYGAAGDCKPCRSGPLVDVRDANVREGCIEKDDRIRERHNYRLYAIAFTPVFTAAVVTAALFNYAFGAVVFGIGSVIGTGIQRALVAMFPPKQLFPYLTRQ